MKIVPPVVLSLVATAGLTVAASARTQSPESPLRLLDVPFIQQSEALCGGAAAAMVMRFWGATGINAESFTALVDASAGGIRAEDLLRDLRSRGWNARSFRGDRVLVAARLAERQPVVALIEDRPGFFHFVVVVGWASGRVVYHDPARAPFRVIDERAFEAAWQKSDGWTLLLLPPPAAGLGERDDGVETEAGVAMPCDGLVTAGIRRAHDGDLAGARDMFAAAAELCPTASAPLREGAGVAALEGNWTDAERLARDAVSRDPSDAHAWRIVGTAAYLRGDTAAALEAWNKTGEPLVDLVTVTGLDRTRHAIATSLIGLDVDDTLTPKALVAADRRLRDLPSVEFARLSYTPLGGGRAAVEAVVVERPLLPTTKTSLAIAAIRFGIDREIVADVSSPTGSGELFQASWRWWENRPRLALSLAAPSRAGVWRMSAFREEQVYGNALNADRERRRGACISLARWTSTMTRWTVAAGVDRWNGEERTFSVSGGVDQQFYADRLSIRAGASLFTGDFDARVLDVEGDWRSRARQEGLVILAGGGWTTVTSDSPRALWAGAGTGYGREPLLRAHSLLEDGRIEGEVFGRSLVHGSGEARLWFGHVLHVLKIAPAAFVDIARAERRMRPGTAWHADVGLGLRIAAPGTGILRVDVGKGLRDGATALSFGWTR